MAEDLVSDELWDNFHRAVNMSSRELQEWLATDAAGESAERFPDQVGTERPRQVLAVLAKRRTDLTADDVTLMGEVVDQIGALRRAGGAGGGRHRVAPRPHDARPRPAQTGRLT